MFEVYGSKHLGSISRPLDDIWFPNIQIVNQQNIISTFPRVVEIYPNGEVVYRQRVWGSFSQPLDLQLFPFDTQRLQITLANVGFGSEGVKLVPSPNSGISESLTMPDWEVTGWGFVASSISLVDESASVQGLVFSLDVKRDSSFFIYKVITPLILIVMMSWMVFWIDPQFCWRSSPPGTDIFFEVQSSLLFPFAPSILWHHNR